MDRSYPNTPSATRRVSAFDFHNSKSHPTTPSAGLRRGQSLTNLARESYREAVAQIHATIYNGKGKDREAVEEVIDRFYDHSAAFETPLTVSVGKQRIADQFGLMALMPGQVYSEIQDVCESHDFNGNRSVLLTHTLHFNLNPLADEIPPSTLTPAHSHPHLRHLQSSASWQDFCRGHPSYDAWTSYAPTPAAVNTPGLDQSPTNDDNDELPEEREPRAANIVYEPSSRSPSTSRQTSRLWTPLSWLAAPIATSNRVINQFTNIHLKILTRLDFNEFDRVFHHEDVYSVKDVIEGVPLLRPFYYLNRRLLAYGVSRASHIVNDSWLLRKPRRSTLQSSSGSSSSTRPHDEEHNALVARHGNTYVEEHRTSHTPTPSALPQLAPSSLSSGLQLDLHSLMLQQEMGNASLQSSYHYNTSMQPYRPHASRSQTSESVPTTMDPDHL